ncbi:putative universal stress protein [Kurthia zopfii]|uniref:Universal stress protein n=1 Tax=Kurthia zopfii TaxID=1650 RepID=A0A8B4Q7M9_9BACL|nr:universal stress protein [Kurthia zopfii]PWI22510.1 universal stress protein UspA [Kurthia zopfii]TDR38640.1 nucleotide-binding universal stress UspA family protein [Kurthia zopfii]GEK31689.1 putative universal stress protein [Kurthia zopfii]STX08753.1 Putative universal stress protein SAV1710 [Kurthia zopfii]
MVQYRNIIVAMDGSDHAKEALKKAIAVSGRNNATLHIVNVIDTRSWANLEAHNAEKLQKDSEVFSQSLIDSYNEAELAGIENINIIVETGSPRTLITHEISRRVNADLIVCGASGTNAAEKILLGSVSENIVRTAECDVLVVRGN